MWRRQRLDICRERVAPGEGLRASEHARLGAAGQAALVLPVVHAVEVRQGDVHVGGVVRDPAGGPVVGADGVHEAAGGAAALLRLIHGVEQKYEEGHVVGQRQARYRAVAPLERVAEAAVALAVAGLLLLGHDILIGDDISKEKMQKKDDKISTEIREER